MKTLFSLVMTAFVAAITLASGLSVGQPIASAAVCEESSISPAEDGSGTYSLCVGGEWVHIDQQLCVDYPDFAPNCVPTSTPTSSSTPTPAPPPPVVVPPPAAPSAPSANVPGLGCTWVDGYTRKSGTRVKGHFRC